MDEKECDSFPHNCRVDDALMCMVHTEVLDKEYHKALLRVARAAEKYDQNTFMQYYGYAAPFRKELRKALEALPEHLQNRPKGFQEIGGQRFINKDLRGEG